MAYLLKRVPVRTCVLVAVLLLCGCIDRESPFIRKLAEIENAHLSEVVRKAIDSDAKLNELHRACTSLPLIRDVSPSWMMMSHEGDRLFYTYRVDVAGEGILKRVRGDWEADGWTFESEDPGIWQSQITMTARSVVATVTAGKFGEDNLKINCTFQRS